MTSLRWDWFRPEDRCFVLPSAKGDRRGARRKGRVLPLPQKAIELLSQVLRSSRDPFVCPGAQPGTHLTTLDKAFALVCRLAGIENATPYALRHTFVSRGKRAGVAVREMSELAGHSDPTMTLSVYDHVDLDDLRAGAEAMGSYFERIIFKAPSTDDQSLETQPEPTGGLPVPA